MEQYTIKDKQKKDINGLTLISIQAYKVSNPFGIEFVEFYELRIWNGHTSHHFIKCIKTDDIKKEFKIILKEKGIRK